MKELFRGRQAWDRPYKMKEKIKLYKSQLAKNATNKPTLSSLNRHIYACLYSPLEHNHNSMGQISRTNYNEFEVLIQLTEEWVKVLVTGQGNSTCQRRKRSYTKFFPRLFLLENEGPLPYPMMEVLVIKLPIPYSLFPCCLFSSQWQSKMLDHLYGDKVKRDHSPSIPRRDRF